MASIHNTLIFRTPAHYNRANNRIERRGSSTVIKEMSDNDYTTFSEEDDVDVNIADTDDNATKVDAVFLKYKGDLTSWQFTPSGGSGSDVMRTVPDEIDNYEGDTVSLEVGGFKHDLYLMTTDQTATSVRMRFTGTDVQVYALMLLELGTSLNANATYTDITFDWVDRAGQVQNDPTGEGDRVETLGAERWKWEYRYSAWLNRVERKELEHFMQQYLNVVFAPEFSRHPERVYPAFWGDLEVRGRYYSVVKGAGDVIEFSVAEA